MLKNPINENDIINLVREVLSEQTSKVNRQDYNRVQFKLDEFENQLSETIKELRKVNDAIPEGLKTVTKGRMDTLYISLGNSQKVLKQLKDKVREHKRTSFVPTPTQPIEEKKKLK